jgi:putative transposase
MKKSRYSADEIAAKLEEADAMSSRGAPQGEIARTLGISVMTYHRWRKARQSLRQSTGNAVSDTVDMQAEDTQIERISQLQLENARLRRLVTDLLLEKMKLEESLEGGRAISHSLKLTGR